MRFSITLILLLISVTLYSQNDFRSGYIIKANGDSLTGLVAYPTTKKELKFCVYKNTKKSKSIKFSPEELLAFGYFHDRRYETKSIFGKGKLKVVFFEIILKGECSLYLFNNVFYLFKDSLIELSAVKVGEREAERELTKQNEKSYVTVLNRLMSDCALVADEIQYDQSDLSNLVQNYNRCLGEEGYLFKRDLPRIKFNYQVSGGITLSTMKMNDYGNIYFNRNTGGFFGASVEISMPQINEKFFVSIDATYYKSLFQGYKEDLKLASIRNDLMVDISLLKLPLGIRYNFLGDYKTPFVKMGVLGTLNVGSTYKSITEEESNGIVITSVVDNKLDSRTQLGLWMSVGYQRGVTGRYKIYIEGKYEKINGYFYGQIQAPTVSNNLNLLIGIRY